MNNKLKFVMLLLFIQSANAVSSYSYGTIYINGRQNLTEVSADINNNSLLQNLGNSEWLLNANLSNNKTTNIFYLNNSDTLWLKINSTYENNSLMCLNYTNLGITEINNTKITSWNTTSNNVESKSSASTCRAFIILHNNTNISNSNVSYLGYYDIDTYGISYKDASWNCIINNTFSNNEFGLYLVNGSNNTISNNTILNSTIYGIYLGSTANKSIINNNNIKYNVFGILVNGNRDTSILQNNLNYSSNAGLSTSKNTSNISIINTNTYNTAFNGYEFWNSTNISIQGGTIDTTDKGIFMFGSNDVFINGTTINNATLNTDAWDVGIAISDNSKNVYLYNLTLSDIGTTGILIKNNNLNITIKNNYIDIKEINSKKNTTNTKDLNEPVTAINIPEIYKGYSINENLFDNLSKFSASKSSNISIRNISFGDNVQILLHTEGATNLSHDLKNYNLISYYFPRLTEKVDLYVSNKWKGNLKSIVTLYSRINPYGKYPDILDTFQVRYFSSNANEVFFNYLIDGSNFTINPQNYYLYYENNSIHDELDLPYNLYIYSPLYTTLVPNKNHTIFDNGTTYVQLYDDILEPNGYHTTKTSIQPLYDLIQLNFTTYNTTNDYKIQFNESSPNSSNQVQYTIGDRQPTTNYSVRIYWDNGTKFQDFYVLSNNTGFLFYNNTDYESDRYTIIEPITQLPTQPYPIEIITITIIIGGVIYYLRRIRKI